MLPNKMDYASKSFMAELLNEAVIKAGAELMMGPKLGASGQIRFPEDGRRVSFVDCCFDVNPFGSSLIARNKGLTRLILEKEGICIPKGKFFSLKIDKYEHWSLNEIEREIIYFAEKIKYPVMVKGADLHRGSCVHKIDSKDELEMIMPEVWKMTDGLIIEEYKPLVDHRLLVFKGEIIAAYGKTPFGIIGDGVRTAGELIREAKTKNEAVSIGSALEKMDNKISRNLKKAGYSSASVIPKNENIVLLEVCNVSTGGTPWDCTENVHSDFHAYVNKIMAALNLKFAGIDILSPNMSLAPEFSYVLEVNSSPDLESYAKLGAYQKGVIQKLAEDLVHEMRDA